MKTQVLLFILDIVLLLLLIGGLLWLDAPWWLYAVAALDGAVSFWQGFAYAQNS